MVASYPYYYSGPEHAFQRLSLSSRATLSAEVLFLRKQLAFYQERQISPRRLTAAARFSVLLWSRFFHWRDALMIVKPETLIGWHRKGFRLWWGGGIPDDLRRLMVRMVRENPTWGEERVAAELSVKLGILVSPLTVRSYWPHDADPKGRRRTSSQHWRCFVRNHAQAIVAADFLVAITAGFRVLMSWWSWKSAAAAFCTVTSRRIRLRPGPFSSFEKRCRVIIVTAS
jgi:hypothetical protein